MFTVSFFQFLWCPLSHFHLIEQCHNLDPESRAPRDWKGKEQRTNHPRRPDGHIIFDS